jgi:hypothetical protein
VADETPAAPEGGKQHPLGHGGPLVVGGPEEIEPEKLQRMLAGEPEPEDEPDE